MFKLASVVVCLVLVRVFSGTLSFARPAPPAGVPFLDTETVCIHDPYGDEGSFPLDDATQVYLFDAMVDALGSDTQPSPLSDDSLRLAQTPRPESARTPTRPASRPRLSIQTWSGARTAQGARGGAPLRGVVAGVRQQAGRVGR